MDTQRCEKKNNRLRKKNKMDTKAIYPYPTPDPASLQCPARSCGQFEVDLGTGPTGTCPNGTTGHYCAYIANVCPNLTGHQLLSGSYDSSGATPQLTCRYSGQFDSTWWKTAVQNLPNAATLSQATVYSVEPGPPQQCPGAPTWCVASGAVSGLFALILLILLIWVIYKKIKG